MEWITRIQCRDRTLPDMQAECLETYARGFNDPGLIRFLESETCVAINPNSLEARFSDEEITGLYAKIPEGLLEFAKLLETVLADILDYSRKRTCCRKPLTLTLLPKFMAFENGTIGKAEFDEVIRAHGAKFSHDYETQKNLNYLLNLEKLRYDPKEKQGLNLEIPGDFGDGYLARLNATITSQSQETPAPILRRPDITTTLLNAISRQAANCAIPGSFTVTPELGPNLSNLVVISEAGQPIRLAEVIRELFGFAHYLQGSLPHYTTCYLFRPLDLGAAN